MDRKIGVGLTTCNRKHLFVKCAKSLPAVHELIIINDGAPYEGQIYPGGISKLVQHTKNKGVGKSKNEALRYLLLQNCTDIFLIEDDVELINPTVFQHYMEASDISGIGHFNFAYHGSENRDGAGNPKPPRRVVTYERGVRIGFHSMLLGAFQYFKREVLEEVGLLDERFKNAYEHVDHTLQIIKAGYHPQYFWFADLADSTQYIRDLDPDHRGSVIRKEFMYSLKLRYYNYLFARKNKSNLNEMIDVPFEKVQERLEQIKKMHARTI